MKKSDISFKLIRPDVDLVSGLASGELAFVQTSTEGVKVIKDLSLPALPPDYEQVWGLHHEELPRTAILTTPHCSASECHKRRASRESRTKGLTLHLNSVQDLFSASDAAIESFLEDMWAFRPQLLLVDPMYLSWFVVRANRLGFTLPPVDLILSSYEYLSIGHRRILDRVFEVPVRNLYTCTELGGCMLGVECGRGHWHVRQDHCQMEIENGLVLATTTANRIMPLTRYETGDLALWTHVECDCPLHDWPTFEFHGRDEDTVGWITTKILDDVVGRHANFYQAVWDGFLTIRLVGSGDHLEIMAAVEATFGIRPIVTYVPRLDPEPSGKFRLLKHEDR